MARETAAALMNWGRAPTMVTIFTGGPALALHGAGDRFGGVLDLLRDILAGEDAN